MSRQRHVSETPATQWLKARKVVFEEKVYDYVSHGGSDEAARQLGLDPHLVVKTLIMQDDAAKPMAVLMHGDMEVSTKALARQIDAKRVEICSPDVAQRHSGYLVGGASPFGLRRLMPVYVEATVLDAAIIHINGGRRGFLVSLPSSVLRDVLMAVVVNVGLP